MLVSSARAVAVMLALLAGSQALAAADVVPKFDMARSCKAETAGNAGVGETMESCLRDEQQARDELAPQWSSYAGDMHPRNQRRRLAELRRAGDLPRNGGRCALEEIVR